MILEIYLTGEAELDDPIASPIVENMIPRVGEHLSLYLELHKGYRKFIVDKVEHFFDCVGKYTGHQIAIWVTEISE